MQQSVDLVPQNLEHPGLPVAWRSDCRMNDDDEINRLFRSVSPQVENLIVLAAIAVIGLSLMVILFWSAPD
jgi:hypothetical protein